MYMYFLMYMYMYMYFFNVYFFKCIKYFIHFFPSYMSWFIEEMTNHYHELFHRKQIDLFCVAFDATTRNVQMPGNCSEVETESHSERGHPVLLVRRGSLVEADASARIGDDGLVAHVLLPARNHIQRHDGSAHSVDRPGDGHRPATPLLLDQTVRQLGLRHLGKDQSEGKKD